MAEKKVLQLNDLIKEKAKYKLGEEKRTAELHMERLGANIIVEVPDTALCIDALSQKDDEDGTKADNYIVYSIIKEPNLKDAELQKAYECDEPTDIITEIFTPGEIADIATFALNEAGFKRGTVKVVESLKN